MRFFLHFHEFLTILSLPIISADISKNISDISDISVKSNYRYIRDYRYFHPWWHDDLTLTWNIKEIKLKLHQELSNNLSNHNS